jgi:hypothetical protein
VEQKGPACHTGARSCFFRALSAPREGWPAASSEASQS